NLVLDHFARVCASCARTLRCTRRYRRGLESAGAVLAPSRRGRLTDRRNYRRPRKYKIISFDTRIRAGVRLRDLSFVRPVVMPRPARCLGLRLKVLLDESQ